MGQPSFDFWSAGCAHVANGQSVRPPVSKCVGSVAPVGEEIATLEATHDRLVREVEETEEKLRDLELDAEEVVMPRGFSRVYTPSREEYERHCLTHLPYRNWCPIIVKAKKRNPAHRRVHCERGVPVFSIEWKRESGKSSQ